MKKQIVTFAAALAVGLILAGACAAQDLRFGPWAYFAPYYFPPFVFDNCAVPVMAFEPRYETPPPPMPKWAPPPPPESKSWKKHKSTARMRPMEQRIWETPPDLPSGPIMQQSVAP